MQKVFALYPNPTVDNGDGFSGTLFFPSRSATDSYNTVAKIDHHFNDRETLSVRYGYDHAFDPNPAHSDILPNIGAFAEKAINEGATGKLTSTLSNTLVNDFQFGWNHVYATFYLPKSVSAVLDSPGGVDQFGNGRDYLMNPFTNFGSTALASDGQFRKTGTTSYSEALSWVHGNNTFKFGFDFRDVGESGADNFLTRRQITTDAVFAFGSDFLGLTTDANGNSIIPGGTEPVQDAALALWGYSIEDSQAEFFNKTGARQATNNKNFRQHEFDWFGQDTWKVRRNLTLTLGLRYQLNGVPYEENANFSNLLRDPGSFATGEPVVFTVVGPGTGKSMFNNDYSDIEPRVGFSWDPWSDGKTSIRGAFGIFHDRIFGNWFGNARGSAALRTGLEQFRAGHHQQCNLCQRFLSRSRSPRRPPRRACRMVRCCRTPRFWIQISTIPPPTIGTSASNTNFPATTSWKLPTLDPWEFTFGAIATEIRPIRRLVQQLVAYCSNPNNAFNCTPDDCDNGFACVSERKSVRGR